jgi:cell division protein FtsB
MGVVYIYIPEYSRLSTLLAKKEELLARNQGYEAQIHDYQNRQNRFLTDPRFVERLVREEFGMVRTHETIYKVIHDATPAPAVGAPAAGAVRR